MTLLMFSHNLLYHCFSHIVQKGNASHLMKMSSKRRRTKTQIEEDKEREKTEKDQLKAKLEEIK